MAHLLIMGTPAPSFALTDTQTSNSAHSYGGVSFGQANSTRLMVLAVTASFRGLTSPLSLSTCSIGGVSATRLGRAFPSSETLTDIWAASVPTGTSGTIAFNGDWTDFFRMSFSVYAIVFLRSTTPTDIQTFTPTSGGNSHVSIDVQANGILVAANGTRDNASFGTPGFSGVTRDYFDKWDQQVSSPFSWWAHESGIFTTTTTVTGRTVASTNLSGSANGLVAVSFR